MKAPTLIVVLAIAAGVWAQGSPDLVTGVSWQASAHPPALKAARAISLLVSDKWETPGEDIDAREAVAEFYRSHAYKIVDLAAHPDLIVAVVPAPQNFRPKVSEIGLTALAGGLQGAGNASGEATTKCSGTSVPEAGSNNSDVDMSCTTTIPPPPEPKRPAAAPPSDVTGGWIVVFDPKNDPVVIVAAQARGLHPLVDAAKRAAKEIGR